MFKTCEFFKQSFYNSLLYFIFLPFIKRIVEKVFHSDIESDFSFIDKRIKTQFEQQKIQEIEICLTQEDGYDEKSGIEQIKSLARRYSINNDIENIHKYFCMLINAGEPKIPLKYAINVFKLKYYYQDLSYFLNENL